MKKLIPLLFATNLAAQEPDLQPLKYNHPGLTVDLGVGLWAWPLPMDWDNDGDLDLVVSCPDKPYNGTYFFENPGGSKMPVFKKAVRIGKGLFNIHASYPNGKPVVLLPGEHALDFVGKGLGKTEKLYQGQLTKGPGQVRAKQWKMADYDGDGNHDLIVGEGYWGEYGWDNAYDHNGHWTNGPLRGWVYLLRNSGTNDQPKYEEPRKIEADGKPVDVYGMPSPNLVDFDGDGDLDLLCGEFLDGFTYFQNTGTTTEPKYAAGKRLPHTMHVQMITPTAIDWDQDGDQDLIVLDHEGYLAFFERRRNPDGTRSLLPGQRIFLDPKGNPIRLNAEIAGKSGRRKIAIVDWDRDGDLDLLVNSTNAELYRNEGTFKNKTILKNIGSLAKRKVSGHTSSPSTIDLDGDGKRELLVGAEDGRFYHKK